MIIYFALLLPLIFVILLYVYFRKKILWWEFLLPFVISLILVISSKAIIETSQVRSDEYWGSIVQRVEYYEAWDEWITATCSRSCCCDSDGQNCGTETYDCSYRAYHSAYWRIVTTTNEVIGISQKEYIRIKKLFANEIFVDMHRNYDLNDGDMYQSKWDGSRNKAVPVTTKHHYENRVKAADQSIFHYGKVTKEDILKYDLKTYPKIKGYSMDAVFGDSSNDAIYSNKKFKYINGLLGPTKEVRVFVLIYKNQPIEAALYQEWLWFGGNMNEFIICIGVNNDRQVQWCKPISWTKNEYLKVDIKDYVQNQTTLNLIELADFTQTTVNEKFVRRSFKEFDYLTVDPPTWAIVLTFVLTILANIATCYWAIINENE